MSVAITRARAAKWAQEAIEDPATVFLDTETTGLDGTAEIVDIGVVDLHGNILLDTLVKPVHRIPSVVSNIHGIFDHHVVDAPSWSDVYVQLRPLLTGRRVVVFNARYDQKMIHQCCTQFRLLAPTCVWECAMLKHAEFVGEPGRWGKGFRWHKLENAAASFGIPPGGHRARADAEACRQVVRRMAQEQLSPSFQTPMFLGID